MGVFVCGNIPDVRSWMDMDMDMGQQWDNGLGRRDTIVGK
jgi:hypothetical protein